MLNDAIIVQSAISAFNNAALAAPAFLWWAILACPLFLVAYKFGGELIAKIGWSRDQMTLRASIWTVGLALVWLVLFGGNYGVLRDGTSVLPCMTAAIAFAASLFIGTHTRGVKMPAWRGMSARGKICYALVVLAIIGMVARSGMHAWWGPILQIGAIAMGLIMGRTARGTVRAIPGVVLVTMATTTVILMQPEYFRFGQLGNLTVLHLAAIMMIGVMAAATVALRNVNPRGRIHHSAYVKLKWMARFVSLLAIALFILTESVPVFLGATVALFVSFALSVWHAPHISQDTATRAFALLLGTFGLITVMPVITVMGVVLWTMSGPAHDFGRLL